MRSLSCSAYLHLDQQVVQAGGAEPLLQRVREVLVLAEHDALDHPTPLAVQPRRTVAAELRSGFRRRSLPHPRPASASAKAAAPSGARAPPSAASPSSPAAGAAVARTTVAPASPPQSADART